MSIATLLNDTVRILKHRGAARSNSSSGQIDLSSLPPDARRLIRDRRYCCILLASGELPFDEASVACARQAVEREMAIVPSGVVRLSIDSVHSDNAGVELVSHRSEPIKVESLYLDRDCVTNADFAKFVDAGGYRNPHYWPAEVLPTVLQFTDSTVNPGPKFWTNGKPPSDRLDHPVVGVCWYEANAYSNWAGKRLPTAEEWQRAGTWHQVHSAGDSEQRYPWGNSFDPSKANLSAKGPGRTVPVQTFASGCTPNGVRQLVGNVWEWVNSTFSPEAGEQAIAMLDQTMGEIRGGAFDTYFHSQATCQFRTGQPLLFRGSNVGFRCCVRASAMPSLTHPTDCECTGEIS